MVASEISSRACEVEFPRREEVLGERSRLAAVYAELDRGLRERAPEKGGRDAGAGRDDQQAGRHETPIAPVESLHLAYPASTLPPLTLTISP